MAGPNPNLTEEELRQAAAEAGISPQELRLALAERHGGVPAVSASRSLMGPPQRGMAATHVESRIGLPPRDALSAVRTSIERQTGKRGHAQGESEFDIVDEDQGLTYRMRVADDGGGGALVRVDIDPSSGKGTQALATTGVLGICATLVALGWLFAASTLWLGGLGIGALGGLLIGRSNLKLRSATHHAHAIAAQALMEAEDRVTIAPRGALPAAD
jgi:hypothetical protein